MNLRQLEYFLVISEERKITAAAEKLNMAQPPLSQQLSLLERAIGTELVTRNSKGIELTDAGRQFASKARQIVDLVHSLENEMNDYNKGALGILNIGIISSSVQTLKLLNLEEWQLSNPKVHFNIVESDTFGVLDLLSKNLVEIAFIRSPFSSEGLHEQIIYSEPIIAVVKKNSRHMDQSFETITPALRLSDLKSKDLIVFKMYENTFVSACRNAKFEPNIICRGSSAITALSCAQAGLGVMVTPKSTVSVNDLNDLAIKDIDCPEMISSICMVWRSDLKQANTVEKFILHVKSIVDRSPKTILGKSSQ